MANLDIDPGHVPLPAAHAPADHPGQLPDPAHLADQGPAPVPLARVLALLAPGTQEPGVQEEAGAQPGLLDKDN